MMKYNKIHDGKYQIHSDNGLMIGTLIRHYQGEWMYRPLVRVFYLSAIELRRIYNKLVLLNNK